MSSQISIRFVTELDYAAIREIYSYYVENTVITFDYETPSQEEMNKKIQSIIPKYPFIVCTLNQEVIGYAYASEFRVKKAYQWSPETTIYLKNGLHGKGIGKALYKALLEILKLQGFCTVYGIITVPNDASIQLHKSLGFTDIATFKNIGYKTGKWHDTHWMQMILNAHHANPDDPTLIGNLQTSSLINTILQTATTSLTGKK